MFAKFTSFNLAVKFSAINLSNSGVVINLLWSVILFSTAVTVAVVAKLVILGISRLTSLILATRVILVAKLVILGILSWISLILVLYSVFSTTSFFTMSLSLLKSGETGFYSSAFNFSNTSVSNLTTSNFKLAKSSFWHTAMYLQLLHF